MSSRMPVTKSSSSALAWRRFGFGCMLLLLGALGFTVVSRSLASAQRARPAEYAVLGGVGMFLAGWVLCGIALSPGSRRGLVVALGFYLLIGIVWTVSFALINPWAVDFSRVNTALFVLYSVFLWPFAIAFAFGLFG
jgi:NADH:ubiquinone oxidoreductase subunit 3 (subunit A)